MKIMILYRTRKGEAMTEEQRKIATEYLGECWHDKAGSFSAYNPNKECQCGLRSHRRTFTTWKDFGDLKDAIVKKGEWGSFLLYAEDCWCNDDNAPCDLCIPGDAQYLDWLISIDRISLMLEWIEKKGKGTV